MIPAEMVIDAYRDTIIKWGMIATARDVCERLQYNIEVNAYDLIYGISKNDVDMKEVLKILEAGRYTYACDNRISNRAQLVWPCFK